MRLQTRILYVLLLLYPPDSLSNATLPDEIHHTVLKSIEYAYKENFKQALAETKKIIKKYPENPAGYFFYAAVLNAQLEYLQSDKYEEEFYQYCDIAISKGEIALEKDSSDMWAKFFIAGANGAKGTYENRYNRLITSFKHGWRGACLFKELYESNPELKDALFGIGMYDYWRSAMIKILWWMPGVEDRRDSAIQLLYQALDSGVYVKENVAVSLVTILCNEKRYTEAEKVIEDFLNKYPSNLLCWWAKVEVQIGLEKYKEAEKSIHYISQLIELSEIDTHYYTVLIRYYLMKIYFNQKRYGECVEEIKKMKMVKLSSLNEKRLEKYFEEAAKIERRALKFKK